MTLDEEKKARSKKQRARLKKRGLIQTAYPLSKPARKTVTLVAALLGVKGFEALERIISGSPKVVKLSRDAYRNFKNG